MKVSDLIGAQLDYWVARADGSNDARVSHYTDTSGSQCETRFTCFVELTPFFPSSNWAQAGPIIERERINLLDLGGAWAARLPTGGIWTGDTVLVAAMRARVASKFGPEVPDARA